MMWRRFTLIFAKYLAIFLILLTLLLTTPWGTRLTLALLNNLDSLAVNYKSGSLIRDIELSKFHLQLDKLDIVINGLSAEFDFSCALKKTLCIKSAKADYFSLRYVTNKEAINQAEGENIADHSLFEMPFSIKATSVEINKSHLKINDTELSIDQLVTQLAINESEFNILQPAVKQLTVSLSANDSTTPTLSQVTTNSLGDTFAQLPEIDLPIALIIEKLHVDDIVIETKTSREPPEQLWQSTNNRLSGTWVHTEISIGQLQTTTSSFSISQFVADAKLQPPYQIDTQFVSHLKNIPWWPEIASSTQQFSLQGSFASLAFDIKSKGSLTLTSQGAVNLFDRDMPFNISMAAEKIPMPLSLAHYAIPSSLSFMLSGNLKEQAIELTSQLNSYGYNNAQIKLSANHQQDHFSIDELLFEDKESSSHLNVQGKLALLPTDTTWQLSAQSTGFSLPKISLESLTELGQNQAQTDALKSNLPDSITGRIQGNIASTGAWSEKQWGISISDTNISGKVNNSNLNIKGDIGLNQTGHLKPGKLFVAFNDSELTLQTAGDSFWGVNGHVSIGNLNQWYHGVNGAFTSDFSVTGEKDNPVIQLKSRATQLNWRHWYSDILKIDGVYQPMNDHKIQLTLNNNQLKLVNENRIVSIDGFNLNVTGDANQHLVESRWLGDFAGQLTLTGQWNDTFTHWQSSVEESTLTYKNTILKNDKAFALNVDLANYHSAIGSHCWQGTGVSACLPDEAIIGESGNITVKLNVDLSAIDELLLPKDIELISQVTGDINAKWSPQQPIRANAYFELSSGYIKVSDDFSEHQLSQWSQGEFSFAIDEQWFTSKLLLTGTDDKTLMHINSTVELIDDYPVDAQIVLNQFNLQPFQSILAEVLNLQGSITANIAIDGMLGSPLINGGITLDKGKVRLSQNANTFDNISSTLTIENNQAILSGNFFLEDSEANLSGNISWQDSLTLNVDLKADALPLVFPPQLVMSISPSLNFSLKEKALTISGNIDVLDGSYNIEKLPEGSVSLSDDVIIVDQHGQAVIKESSGFDIKTNIRVNIAKAFEVSGQGLQTHLLGQLQIRQKKNQPFQLFGRIQSNDGTFQAYGQKLQIDKGEFTFNGPIDNPYFNLRASRHIKAEDIDVGIQVTGLADALDMQLFSSPTMEMPEMLSYLVRGRSLDAGTENSTAAASFLVGFGVTNSMGLFDQIEKIPLISNIAVDTEGEGDKTQATVSGYLGNRVYLKYGIGVYEPINELTVRMYIFNRFWLEIVSGIEQSTDLYYSFDID